MAKENDRIDIMSPERHQFKSTNQSFSKQEVDFKETPLFFPEGFEKIFLLIYIITLPYLTGLIFTFIYLAKSDYKLFLTLNHETPFFLTWTIGYEILAALILTYIVKMAISFSASNKKGFDKNFKRPA